MNTISNNNQTSFRGYDARRLKALCLSEPKKELGMELEKIGQKVGFDVFIPSGRNLLKASEAKTAYVSLAGSPWAQDIATVSPKKKIITNEYFDDFADNMSRKLDMPKEFDREIPQGGNMYYIKDSDGRDIIIAGQDAEKNINKLNNPKEILGADKIEYIPQMDYHIDLFVRPLDKKRILLADDSLMLKSFNKGIKSIQELIKKAQDETKKLELSKTLANLKSELKHFQTSIKSNIQASKQNVETSLKDKGFQVINVPARIYRTDPETKELINPENQILVHSLNYINAIVTKNKKGEMVYISNKSDFDKRIGLTPEIIKESGFSFEKEFVKSLKPYIKEENVHFVEGKNGEIQDSLENLAGGIHCLTTEIPE